MIRQEGPYLVGPLFKRRAPLAFVAVVVLNVFPASSPSSRSRTPPSRLQRGRPPRSSSASTS
jgi:hypothetical protein